MTKTPEPSLPATAPPALPPTGRILFECQRPTPAVCVLNADGSGSVAVLRTSALDGAWSPDGTRVAYANESGDVFVMNIDGSGVTRIHHDSTTWAQFPTWSLDGRQIAFETHPTCSLDACISPWTIFVMMADGSDIATVTDEASGDRPGWSPDGRRLVFAPSSGGLASIAVDGTGLTPLTTDADVSGAWSPDGRKIVFQRQGAADAAGNVHALLFVVNADGSNSVQLTHGTANDQFAAWSPDGAWIAWTRFVTAANGDRRSDVWVMRADGTGAFDLTNSPTPVNLDAWR